MSCISVPVAPILAKKHSFGLIIISPTTVPEAVPAPRFIARVAVVDVLPSVVPECLTNKK